MFDLNINHYTEKEMEELFGFENSDYNIDDLNANFVKILSNVHQNHDVGLEQKERIISFLNNIKQRLENTKSIVSNVFEKDNHFLINKVGEIKDPVFEHQFTNDVLNPIKKNTLVKLVNVDTKFRENNTTTMSSDFSVSLDVKLNDCLELKIKSIEPPENYNSISSVINNNSFWVDNNGTKTLIEVANGNYVNNINALVQDISSEFNDLGQGWGITHNETTGKISINYMNTEGYSGANDYIALYFDRSNNSADSIDTYNLETKLGNILGFSDASYNVSLNGGGTKTITGNVKANLDGSTYAYLVVDDFQNNVNQTIVSAYNKYINQSSILARISFKNYAKTLDYLVNPVRKYFGPIDIQKLKIQLVDEYGRVMDTTGVDYSFLLEIETVYNV